MKRLKVTVDGKVYDVVVETLDATGAAAPAVAAPVANAPVSGASVTAPVSAPKPAAPKAAAGASDITSPLAGKVVSIDVKVGDTVTDSQQVATLEAMKMNTYIYAPKAGKISEICAKPGDGVEEGAVLIRMA
jgi:glutaconyl-CoA/methylmalonyl-CoA decarboxylase subunit gamma